MFPYRDDNPTILTPYVTVAVIVVTCLAWVVVQGAGSPTALARSVCEHGLIPADLLGTARPGTAVPMGPGMACRLGGGGAWVGVFSSMFMHGGWFHLIGNMWFLWVFGNNVEDAMGHGRFVAFYLLCGVLAAAAQVVADTESVVPMVGASGAISGIMGAYLVLYPKVRVHMLIFLGFFITTVAVPAYLMLIYWAFLQLAGSVPQVTGATGGGGVAFLAHLGGFVAGVVLIKLFAKPELVAAHRARRQIKFREFAGDRWY
jgi:membrane associated rhomboid family serine protease